MWYDKLLWIRTLWVFESAEGEKHPQKISRRIYIWDEKLPVSSSVLCALGFTSGFYTSAFYAYFKCRLRLSCNDGIFWDSWLACGLWTKWFLLNVRLYEDINRQSTAHIWHCCTHWHTQTKTNACWAFTNINVVYELIYVQSCIWLTIISVATPHYSWSQTILAFPQITSVKKDLGDWWFIFIETEQ